MNIDEIIDKFEDEKETKLTDLILLGKNGAIRRYTFEDDEEPRYFG